MKDLGVYHQTFGCDQQHLREKWWFDCDFRLDWFRSPSGLTKHHGKWRIKLDMLHIYIGFLVCNHISSLDAKSFMGSGKPLDGLWKWVNLSLASHWNEINNLEDTNLVCGFAHDSIHIIHVPFLTQHPSSASTSIWGPFLTPGPTLIQVVHVWCENHDGILGNPYFDLYHMLWCCLSHHLHISHIYSYLWPF